MPVRKVKPCRRGRINTSEQGCLADVFFKIRLPQSPSPLCDDFLGPIVDSIYPEINDITDNDASIYGKGFENRLMIIDGNGYNIYELTIFAESLVNISRSAKARQGVITVLSTGMLTVGVTDGTFCMFTGDYDGQVLPEHKLSSCEGGEEHEVTWSAQRPELPVNYTCAPSNGGNRLFSDVIEIFLGNRFLALCFFFEWTFLHKVPTTCVQG